MAAAFLFLPPSLSRLPIDQLRGQEGGERERETNHTRLLSYAIFDALAGRRDFYRMYLRSLYQSICSLLFQNVLRELEQKKPQLDELVKTAENLRESPIKQQIPAKGKNNATILLCVLHPARHAFSSDRSTSAVHKIATKKCMPTSCISFGRPQRLAITGSGGAAATARSRSLCT